MSNGTTTWTDMFVRDSLQDTGVVPSPGYPYTSPDIICTQLTTYQDPTTVFTDNYSSDPNVSALAHQNNYFYTRAKNLGSTTQGGTMYVYRLPPSLLPPSSSLWSDPLYILVMNSSGQQVPQYYSPMPAVAPNAISVQQVPFIWATPKTGHYCNFAICSTTQHPFDPSNPPTFATWQDFVTWVQANQNVCWRNLQVVPNPNVPKWDTTTLFANSYDEAVPLLLSAQCSNVPVGTEVVLECNALGISCVNTVSSSDPNPTFYADAVTVPANFSGYVETVATVPSGTSWPSGANIQTSCYLGTAAFDPVARFAKDFGADTEHPKVLAALRLIDAEQGVLVQGGSYMIAYPGL